MTCKLKTYTLSLNEGAYDFEEGDTSAGKFKAMVIEITECDARYFEQINSPRKETRDEVCKQIDRILNTN